MISVIIPTKNRNNKLYRCIRSIVNNTFQQYEIIIIDQNDFTHPTNLWLSQVNSQIKYFHYPRGGKSMALNTALHQAKGNIIAFTDDDCIVSKTWLASIYKSFSLHPNIVGVFGSTYPYLPTKVPHTICPSTFTYKKSRHIRRISHISQIGFGNNMAIRKQSLRAVGGFRAWLGPGTIAPAAEDAEIATRLLAYNNELFYEPAMRVHHNRWLYSSEMRRQDVLYYRGEFACYAYYASQKYLVTQYNITQKMLILVHRIQIVWKNMFYKGLNRDTIGATYWQTRIFTSALLGVCIGLYFALIDPIDKNTKMTQDIKYSQP
ncbi:glycosyltransferase family 2 protein [Candidatus Woesebacteria bacterium]|nr:glycosyltransferase family 2 protein [Candidatus Woesebacteria bacterium]